MAPEDWAGYVATASYTDAELVFRCAALDRGIAEYGH